MTRAERIKNILDEKGTIKTEIIEVEKGCEKLQGLSIGEYQTRFTVYPDKMDFTDEEILEIIEEMSNEKPPQFDPEILENWENAKRNARLCVRPVTDDETSTVPFLDLEKYVRVFLDEHASVKITDEMIDFYGVSKEKVFKDAMLHSGYTVTPIIETLKTLMEGIGPEEQSFLEDDLSLEEIDEREECPLFVVTNKDRMYGAAAICNKALLELISNYLNVDAFYVIPSSIHELLVCPVQIGLGFIRRAHLETLEQLDDNDFLSKHIYMYNRFNGDGKMITVC